ncbi:MAG: hypothetical protein QY326_00415 [Bdellovibrionota bacterium]|nr:MAG: hypothetical protein QY326_00415 [Bdellovibrionota bacterium]
MSRTIFSTYISVFITILAFVIGMRVALHSPEQRDAEPSPDEPVEIATLYIEQAFDGRRLKSEELQGIISVLRQHDIRALFVTHYPALEAFDRMREIHTFLLDSGVPASAIDLRVLEGPSSQGLQISLFSSEGR